jgi:hypothetical protein
MTSLCCKLMRNLCTHTLVTSLPEKPGALLVELLYVLNSLEACFGHGGIKSFFNAQKLS